MLLRVGLIILILFAVGFGLLWLITSTNYFNRARVLACLKSFGIAIGAALFTILAFILIAGTDHIL